MDDCVHLSSGKPDERPKRRERVKSIPWGFESQTGKNSQKEKVRGEGGGKKGKTGIPLD